MKSKIVYGVQILLALAFLAAGTAKLAGVPMMVQGFDSLGLGQWFRYVTGIIEVGGAIALLMRASAGYAGALMSCVMAGAVIAHLTRWPGSPAPAMVLLALSTLVAWYRLIKPVTRAT